MAQQPGQKAVQGGKHIGQVLKEEGVDVYFGIGGGHINPEMIGMGMSGIKLVHCRHEQAGGYAADAYARASGKLGVCVGTAGPGMTNTVSAVAQAYFCKSPVLAIYGQYSTIEDGRGAMQESRADQITNSITKWTRRIVSPYTLAYMTKKACRDAMTYPQGPVALEIPLDIVRTRSTLSQQVGWVPNAYKEPAPPAADAASVEAAVRLLLSAQRPVIAGGEAIFWSHAEKELQEFVELVNVPVITRRVGRGAVPEDHPLAFSGRARGEILRSADVACIIGLNLGMLEGFGAWAAKLKLIQITESKSDIETAAPTEMIILASPKAALQQMIAFVKENYKNGVPRKEAWLKQVDDTKKKDLARLNATIAQYKGKAPIHPSVLADEVCEFLDKDATIILDSFTASHYFTERFVSKHSGGVLDSGTFAGVGHGVGMGIGAQLARPGKQVVAVMGDGGMGLGGFDIETAVRSEAPVCYLLNNNSAWMSAFSPLNIKAMPTVGVKPDYCPTFMVPTRYDQLFAAMGAYTERVDKPEDIKPALERAFKSGKTSVLDVMVDRTAQLTSGAGVVPIEQRIKGMLAMMDPEDFPDDIRAKYIDGKV